MKNAEILKKLLGEEWFTQSLYYPIKQAIRDMDVRGVRCESLKQGCNLFIGKDCIYSPRTLAMYQNDSLQLALVSLNDLCEKIRTENITEKYAELYVKLINFIVTYDENNE